MDSENSHATGYLLGLREAAAIADRHASKDQGDRKAAVAEGYRYAAHLIADEIRRRETTVTGGAAVKPQAPYSPLRAARGTGK